MRDHEPRKALDGGPDGTDLLRPLLRQAGAYLRPGGAVMLEIDDEQGATMAHAARSTFPAASVRVLCDLAGRDRVLVVSRREGHARFGDSYDIVKRSLLQWLSLHVGRPLNGFAGGAYP